MSTTKSSKPIGSFRNVENLQQLLPEELYKSIFQDISTDLDVGQLITLKTKQVNFNNGAFGHAYNDVRNLSRMLRDFSEDHPEIFYDQVCLPLINYAYDVGEKFYQTENILLVPNCTFAMKSIAELLIRKKEHKKVACLLPIYGATMKLLKYYHSNDLIEKLVGIAAGENPLFTEDPLVIRKALLDSYNKHKYTLLFCDETASQSGRRLPLDTLVEFCQEYGIKLIVDGTQSCELFFGKQKKIMKEIDYFVMSTHKWIGNTKTCGVILYKDVPPSPPAISFGWNEDHETQEEMSKEDVRAQFQWQGMMDSYVSYITLSKALKMFSIYGEQQLDHASKLLQKGLSDILKVNTLLPLTKSRVMNIFELRNSQFESLDDLNKIQNSLQSYGVFISVKKVGQDCSGFSIDGQSMNGGFVLNGVSPNNNSETNGLSNFDMNGNETISYGVGELKNVENGFTDENLPLNDARNGASCKRPTSHYYMRASCWSFNKKDDFYALNDVFNTNLRLSSTTTAGLRQQFLFMFNLYEELFSVLKTKAFFIRAEPLRHHLIFYYAHTAVFYINKLVVSGFLQSTERINARLESLMSVGVDEMGWDDLLEENYDWSGVSDDKLECYLDQVKDYRFKVRDLVESLLDEYPLTNGIKEGSFHWVILMGIEHEKIHLETSAVIISQVPLTLIKTKHNFNYPTYWRGRKEINKSDHPPVAKSPNEVPHNQLLPIPSGTVHMGKENLEQDLYGWDNEYGNETKVLDGFQASEMLVSNAEYLEFINDGGYENMKWWTPEGWRYVTKLKISQPRFWRGKTHYRAMLKEIPMPWNFPVEVNCLEAEAFCNWKSEKLGKKLRLISHEEAFHMRQIAKEETSNFNLNEYASPTPVNLYGGFINNNKIFDISGNVWRHSVSVLTVMDGFRTDPYYNDFTLPTIDGYHNHILQGSWISMGNATNMNARYGFRRHFYQYAGIRYVESNNTYHDKVATIFDEVEITRHITENYTDFTTKTLLDKQPVPNWPKLLGNKAGHIINEENRLKVVDGQYKVLVAYGGVGRVTFELLRQCKNLTIDHSDVTANKLKVLEHLLSESRVQWHQQIEGRLTQLHEFHTSEVNDGTMLENNNSVNYWQVDYRNIRPQLDGYDIIVADIRHKDAAEEITHLASRIKDGGLLIVGTIDNTTLTSYNTKHALQSLHHNFQLISSVEDFAHIYCETRNKHQYAVSYFSVWRKTSPAGLQSLVKGDEIASSNEVSTTEEYYEDENILTSYHRFHFGDGLLSVQNFPLRMSEVILEACKQYGCTMDVALDAGCGPGRTAIELCKAFKKVEAYDYSQSFVDMMEKYKVDHDLLNLTCYQGDSHKQEEICHANKFDMIFGCNLIDRLHTPEMWINQSKNMLKTGGLLIIASPYTWKTEHTNLNQWIGGFKQHGEDYSTLDGLKCICAPELKLLQQVKVPFVIPDADGTYQYTYSQCTIFG